MSGIDKLREHFGEFNDNYVIIGGTACNLNLEAADLRGRATKDIDMIVIRENLSPEYIRQFRRFIRTGGYKAYVINTVQGARQCFYRFVNPTDHSFPAYIELFSRALDGIQIPENAHLTRVDTDDDYPYGFSAILLDDDYYNYAVARSLEIEGVRVLDKDALIVLKAKAYLNNRKRRDEGWRVHSEDIEKHKRDVYRLSFLFSGEERYDMPDNMKSDLGMSNK
jgi:hypothetical protein